MKTLFFWKRCKNKKKLKSTLEDFVKNAKQTIKNERRDFKWLSSLIMKFTRCHQTIDFFLFNFYQLNNECRLSYEIFWSNSIIL